MIEHTIWIVYFFKNKYDMIYMILVYGLSAIIIWKMILTMWFIYFYDLRATESWTFHQRIWEVWIQIRNGKVAPIKMGMDGISHQSRDSFFSKPFPDQLWIHV